MEVTGFESFFMANELLLKIVILLEGILRVNIYAALCKNLVFYCREMLTPG